MRTPLPCYYQDVCVLYPVSLSVYASSLGGQKEAIYLSVVVAYYFDLFNDTHVWKTNGNVTVLLFSFIAYRSLPQHQHLRN
jgi:hypothetical protein